MQTLPHPSRLRNFTFYFFPGHLLPAGPYRKNFLAAKAANPAMLEEFASMLRNEEENGEEKSPSPEPSEEGQLDEGLIGGGAGSTGIESEGSGTGGFKGFVAKHKALVCIEDPFNPEVCCRMFFECRFCKRDIIFSYDNVGRMLDSRVWNIILTEFFRAFRLLQEGQTFAEVCRPRSVAFGNQNNQRGNKQR